MSALDDSPRRALCDIVARIGSVAWIDHNQLHGLLLDTCGTFTLEVNLLVLAARERVPQELQQAQSAGTPAEIGATHLKDRLVTQRGIGEERARWAVGSWASCLGITLSPTWLGGGATGGSGGVTGTGGAVSPPNSPGPEPWRGGHWKTPAQANIQVSETSRGQHITRYEFRPYILPTSVADIEPPTASRVDRLARIGLGSLQRMALSPGEGLLVAITSAGIELRASANLELKAFLEGPATDATFNNNGRGLAVARPDGTVQIWDLADGRIAATMRHPEARTISQLLFSPDGKYLAAATHVVSGAGASGGALQWTIHLWEISSRNMARAISPQTGKISGMAFSPDSKRLFRASESGATALYNVETGVEGIKFGAANSQVTALALSANGQNLALAHANNKIQLHNASNAAGLCTLSGHTGRISGLVFSPGGGTLVSASADTTARQWDGVTGTFQRALVEHSSDVTFVLYSPDGQFLYTASKDGDLHKYRASDGRTLVTLRGHSHKVKSLVFSPDNKTLVLGCENNNAQLCRVRDGQVTHTLTGHVAPVNSVAYSPNGSMLATGSDDSTIRIWRATDGTPLRTIADQGPIKAVCFSWDSTKILRGTGTLILREYRVDDGAVIGNYPSNLAGYPMGDDLSYSPDGQTIAVVWAPPPYQYISLLTAPAFLMTKYIAHSGKVLCLAFSPDSIYIASGTQSKTVKISRVADAGEVRTLTDHTGPVTRVAYTKDGRVLATASEDGMVRLWRAHDGVMLRTLSTGGPILAMTISPDGKLIATGSLEGIVLWGIDDD